MFHATAPAEGGGGVQGPPGAGLEAYIRVLAGAEKVCNWWLGERLYNSALRAAFKCLPRDAGLRRSDVNYDAVKRYKSSVGTIDAKREGEFRRDEGEKRYLGTNKKYRIRDD
jgi:hypothetical protein